MVRGGSVLALALWALHEVPAAASESPYGASFPEISFPSEHARQALEADAGAFRRLRSSRPVSASSRTVSSPPRSWLGPTDAPAVKVYGYLAYWADDLDTVPWEQLTHIALFSAGVDSAGNLSGTSHWGDIAAVKARADLHGVKVHLTVTNFSTSSISAFLDSAAARQKLIDQLTEKVYTYDLAGVNIDFEGLSRTRKAQMVDFAADLDDVFDEVVFATPAVDWNGAYDYSELSKYGDLFIMGYGYHYSGSSEAGPTDPLYGGGPWGAHCLDWTIEDYRASDAIMSRVILGLPLYGYSWATPSDAVGVTASSGGSTLFYTDGQARTALYGGRYDTVSRSPWSYGGGRQHWVPNAESVRERVAYSVEEDIGGVGIWALNYDVQDGVPDSALWDGFEEETAPAASGDTDAGDGSDTDIATPSDTDATENASSDGGLNGGFFADAGAAFYAYVGDTVELRADGSEGPVGQSLQYRWTQAAGATVVLDDYQSARPRFAVEQPGTYTFELVVGDGSNWSAPARSQVVVVDRDVAAYWGGGCASAGSSGLRSVGLVAVAALAGLRRRRRG
jgi:spore germination protein YaaH